MDRSQNTGHINGGFVLNDMADNRPENVHTEEIQVKIDKPVLNGNVDKTTLNGSVRNGKKKTIKDEKEKTKTDKEKENWKLIYKLGESPPIHLTILFALQQVLMSLPGNVIVSILVARCVCGEHDDEIKSQLLSTTIFMSALTTLLQVTFGIRLSVYQGPTAAYLIPILALSSLPEWKCPAYNQTEILNSNETETNISVSVFDYRETYVLPRLQLLQGSLVFAGGIHMLIGMTGLIGVLLKYLGPITVIPTLLLLGIEFYSVVTNLCESQWAVSTATAVIGMIFAVYLEGWQMPIPIWTKSKGFHVIRYPLQQVLAILLSMGIGWLICGILTATGVLTDNPDEKEYKTRTDSGSEAIAKTPWFYMPYPGQFGPIDFSLGIFIGFLSAVMTSIIDSVADYYACAKMCHVPPPPVHAVNRGIMIEGLMSVVSGFYGTGHGTTTYGGNIGCIGITKVASRSVYQVFSIFMIILSVWGKFGAVFVSIPDPVLGGSIVVGFGIFVGLVLTNLQYIDLNSSRNLAVLGVSILVGLMIPNWTKKNSERIDTGLEDLDQFIRTILTNPTLFGGGLAFFLDNTVKGTAKQRGLAAWDTESVMKSNDKKTMDGWEEDESVYEIISISQRLKSISFLKYIPVMPNFDKYSFKCCR